MRAVDGKGDDTARQDDDLLPAVAAPADRPAPQPGRMREAAARLDRSPALVKALERLRRHLPGDAHFGDPLSTADRTAASLVAREVAALDPGRPSVVQELGMGALQLWQVLSVGLKGGTPDHEVAILFTDLVGFSSWALKAGDEAAVQLLRETSAVLEEAVAAQGGRVVKRLGDGLMATFRHPADGVGAALDAIESLAAVEVAGYHPRMRAGVHWGRPTKVGGDFLGIDVNVAARVADEAKGEQLLVSDAAFALLETAELKVGRARKLRAKGAPSDLRVRRVQRLPAA